MKKFLYLLVAVTLMFSLVGCTSTNPSLKDVWLNAVNQKSVEANATISANVNIDGMDLDEEQMRILELLEAGFVVEEKVQDEEHIYLKITAVNDQPFRDLGVWTAKEKAAAEIIIKKDTMYFRTSADPFFFKVDMNELGDLDSNLQSQSEMQKQLKEFMKGEFTNYVSQFNYKIPKIQDLGMKTIETPEGKEQVLKVKMNLGVNDVLHFAVYTLDNLANYQNLDKIVKEALTFSSTEDKLSDAEITAAVAETRTQMNQFSAMLKGMTEESLEQMAGVQFDFNVETEFGISKEKYIASEDTVVNVGIKDPTTGEKGSAVIKLSSLVWNVNGDVKIPNVTNAVDAMDYSKDINKVRTLPDSTPLKTLFMQEFNATFTIGEPFAMLGGDFEQLDAAPYIKNGSTMVPLATVGKWLGSEAKWDSSTGRVTLDNKNTKIELKLGSTDAYVNGKLVKMATAAETLNGRTFVPVKFIAKELGAQSSFDPESQEVEIYFE